MCFASSSGLRQATVPVHHLRYLYNMSVYRHKTDIGSNGCYKLECDKDRVMQLSNSVGPTSNAILRVITSVT